MKRIKKVVLVLFTALMISCLVTGCHKATVEPSEQTKVSNVQSMNKDGKSITTSLEANEYTVVQTSPDNLYDIQIKTNNDTVVMSGQFLDKADYEYFRESYLKGTDDSKLSEKTCNGINYLIIPQGDTNKECCVLGNFDDENGIIFYSFEGVDQTVEILNSLTLTMDKE